MGQPFRHGERSEATRITAQPKDEAACSGFTFRDTDESVWIASSGLPPHKDDLAAPPAPHMAACQMVA